MANSDYPISTGGSENLLRTKNKSYWNVSDYPIVFESEYPSSSVPDYPNARGSTATHGGVGCSGDTGRERESGGTGEVHTLTLSA